MEPGAISRFVRSAMEEVSHHHGALVSKARVSGLLCPAEYLAREVSPALRPIIAKMNAQNATPEYCIIVQEEQKYHSVKLAQSHDVDMYSGYIWKCISPDRAVSDESCSLSDCFFVWEHTDLSNRDCIAYNLDSLENKINYITKLLRSSAALDSQMKLLQRLTPEDRLRAGAQVELPLLRTEDFLNIFTEGSDFR